MKDYNIIIIGAGASGVFASYEFTKLKSNLKILMIDKGNPLEKRICPIKIGKVDKCINCNPCNIMNGYGGAGTLSDGKYNITNSFGGDLHAYLGKDKAIELMEYVDEVLCEFDGGNSKLYTTSNSNLKTTALRHDLHLLDAKVRHFGTDRNMKILKKMYDFSKENIEMQFNTFCTDINYFEDENKYEVVTSNENYKCDKVILCSGRSGSKWMSEICNKFNIKLESNQVDIGVRVELPAEVFKHITDVVYESKIVYQTKLYNDLIRTFCMNPYGQVVSENTNGIITVNGHSYSDKKLQSENTNFALLVTNCFTEPFKDSNEYGESVAKLSNMLGGGIILQRFGDLIKGRRSSDRRMKKCFTRPTLKATPGDLSLVIPKRQMDSIIEMIYALDKIAPGTANEDTLLYGVEVKFYNSKVKVDSNFQTDKKGLFVVGDGGGVTHSLSQASASGVYVARYLTSLF
ncbi:NAD(P)/FAD-dependent oxidoreductase [Peptoniphilus catoniae]|uniref:NAD(P)/FAD-dependent oxidoreductase n=1 Tax=Peptoniphilus catoniae TaxID=1660341 RepID=UPI0010FD25E6|nr:NAD(P)/FAD-dependent oxidoreductase [Peptoniphilus catoniae]